MKPVWYYDEVYRQNFYFFHGWPRDKFTSYLKKTFGEDYRMQVSGYDGVTIRLKKKSQIVVWTNANKHKLGNLVHEITHATNMVFHTACIEPSFINDEAQAYYNGMLFRKALGK